MTLWLDSHSAKFYSPRFCETELHSGVTRSTVRACPTLLLLRLVLESAFVDLQKISNGAPAEAALAAEEWISCDLDYSRRVTKPPPELRSEAIMSFVWVCHYLDLNPASVRLEGIARISGLSHNSTAWLPGLPAAYERWRRAREEYEAKQHSTAEEIETGEHACAMAASG